MADLMGIGSVFDFGSKIIDRFFPDPAAAAAAKLEMFKAQQAGEFKQEEQVFELAKGQISINAAEAASADPFTSRWRPFIGWVCGFGCAWNWIGLPVAVFAMEAIGHPVKVTQADLSEMLPLLIGMLGLGGMRSYDKKQGTSK